MKKFLLVCFALLCSGLSTQIASSEPISQLETKQIQQVIADQLDAFIAGDGQRAYGHAAPRIKQYFPSVERFMTMVEQGYGPIYKSTTHDFGRSAVQNEQVYQELILTDQAGKTWQSIYVMEQQGDGSWKINGVEMRPSQSSIL